MSASPGNAEIGTIKATGPVKFQSVANRFCIFSKLFNAFSKLFNECRLGHHEQPLMDTNTFCALVVKHFLELLEASLNCL